MNQAVDIRSYALGAEYGAIVAMLELNQDLKVTIERVIDADNLYAVEGAAAAMGWEIESDLTAYDGKAYVKISREYEPAAVSDCQGELIVNPDLENVLRGRLPPKKGAHLTVVK